MLILLMHLKRLQKFSNTEGLKSQFLQGIYTEKLEVPNEVINNSMNVM